MLVEFPPTLPAPPPPPPDQFASALPRVPTPPLFPCEGDTEGVFPEPAAFEQQPPPPEPPLPPAEPCPPPPPPAAEVDPKLEAAPAFPSLPDDPPDVLAAASPPLPTAIETVPAGVTETPVKYL